MQITRTNNSSTNVGLKIVADAKDLEPIKAHSLRHFASQVKIPGFRTGTAPLAVLEKHVDPKALTDEFLEHAMNELYRKAITQENLRPVGQPDVKLTKFVPYTLLEFNATQEVIGKVTLPAYKTIKLAKTKPTVTAAELSEVLDNLLNRSAERKEVDRAAKLGDEITIDFEGADTAGKAIDGASGKDYPLTLGSKSFIPGFEEEIVGLKTGDKKDFVVTFPKDYGAAQLQNKKVTFSVSVKKVNEVVKPKLDDKYVTTVGPFKTVAELKADVKKQLEQEKSTQANQAYENELIQKIAEKTKVDIPASMIEEQVQFMEDDEKKNLAYRGQTWEEHLKSEGITEQEHRDRNKPDAESRIKAGLVLSEIAEQEGLTVSDQELEDKIKELKAQYSDDQMQTELDIKARLLTEKTITKLIQYASK